MHKLTSMAWLITALFPTFALTSGAAMAADQTIDAFELAQQAAWNAHDAAAYTAAFDPDSDIITSLAWQWMGQNEAAHNIGEGFRFVYARAQLRIADVKVRMLTPELALVNLSWAIDGARAIDTGLPAKAQHGFETQILQRRGGSWVVIAQQDTAALSAPVLPTEPTPSAALTPPPVSAFPTTAPPVRRCIVGRANGDCLIYGKAK